ncbi:MAG: hypothetical protein ACI8X5_002264 [Planctomycetota bacterium]|jgi:hypothetical protein
MPILYVLSGPDIGKTFELSNGAILGRGPECDAVLRGNGVSRKHARLEEAADGWSLIDLDSRNGISDESGRHRKINLIDGQRFDVGQLEMRYRFESQGATAPPRPLPRQEAIAATENEPDEIEPKGIEFEEELQEELDDEILFEGEELFDEPSPVAAPAPRSVPAPAPNRAPTPERRVSSSQPESASAPVRESRPALQFSGHKEPSGFFSADLSQYPLPLRLLAGLIVLALFVGLFYFAYRATGTLKERAVGVQVDESN